MNVQRIALFTLIFALLLGACSPQAPGAAPPAAETAAAPAEEAAATAAPASFTLTDALGRTLTFARAPQRIVVAGRAAIMVNDALFLFPEAGRRIVALGDTNQGNGDFIAQIDPEYSQKMILATDVGPEQVAAARPDVVILKSSMAEKLGAPLESLGIPVVYVDFETPELYQRDLAALGQLFQNPQRAEQVAAYYRRQFERVAQKTTGLSEAQKRRVLLLYYTDRDGQVAFNVPPLSWMQTILVETAGGVPVWQDIELGKSWNKVGLEQIAAWDADQIYLVAYNRNSSEIVAALKNDPQWQALRAVKNGELYAFPADFYSWDQPDVRWILGLTWLATKVQPELFAGVDVLQEARAFFQEMYGFDQAAFEKWIQPRLKGDLR